MNFFTWTHTALYHYMLWIASASIHQSCDRPKKNTHRAIAQKKNTHTHSYSCIIIASMELQVLGHKPSVICNSVYRTSYKWSFAQRTKCVTQTRKIDEQVFLGPPTARSLLQHKNLFGLVWWQIYTCIHGDVLYLHLCLPDCECSVDRFIIGIILKWANFSDFCTRFCQQLFSQYILCFQWWIFEIVFATQYLFV